MFAGGEPIVEILSVRTGRDIADPGEGEAFIAASAKDLGCEIAGLWIAPGHGDQTIANLRRSRSVIGAPDQR